MPVTRHGRQQRKSGGVGTKPEARRIAANNAGPSRARRKPVAAKPTPELGQRRPRQTKK
jgi:hypothetical protein